MFNAKSICLLACICLLLVGCSHRISAETVTQTAEMALPTHTPPTSVCSLIAATSISSFEEYTQYIETETLPENFVPFDRVSHFGVFDCFTCCKNPESGRFSSNNHYYDAIDSTGIRFEISIYPDDPREPLFPVASATPDLTDMRWLGNDETGRYLYGDVSYEYIKGRFYSISVVINGVVIRIRPVQSQMENGVYPYIETTVFGKLMNIQNKTPEEVMQLVLNG